MPEIQNDPEAFIKKAKALVAQEYNHHFLDEDEADPVDFYVVWFAKTLQNWKALLSTDLESGLYWEVTYNGDKKETYVDTYVKKHNTAVPDLAPGAVWQ
jgi:hypothetical protein